MGKKTSKQQIHIDASPQECFDAITDYDTITEWQTAASSAEVLERHEDGRGKVVEWEADLKIRKINYVLDYSYEEPGLVTWEYLEGDAKEIEGHYVFEEQPDGTTLATLTLHIDPGMWVPGKIANMLNDQMLTRSLKELKDRVESVAKVS